VLNIDCVRFAKSPRIPAVWVFVALLAQGCAAPQPIPFQLVDNQSRVERGAIFPGSQRIEVAVDGHLFSGFYIVATGSAVSESFGGRSLFSRETITSFSSNSARAHLIAEDGQRLSCEFLFQGRHAIGECRSPAGAIFQLIADGN
jgi:hypothetical protein